MTPVPPDPSWPMVVLIVFFVAAVFVLSAFIGLANHYFGGGL
jgi:hypothetical protein